MPLCPCVCVPPPAPTPFSSQVTLCVAVCSVAVLILGARAFLASLTSAAPRPKTAASARRGSLWGLATDTNALGGGGWAIPLGTLLFGYYINLVPYQLITRSK
jgi:hypothetical protein